LVAPEPNNTLLWMRPTVALHNAIKAPKKAKGLRNWLKNKIGSAPVQLAEVPLKDVNAAIVNRLNNHGYFQAHSRYEVSTRGRRAYVAFIVSTGTPHRLNNITYGNARDTLSAHIAQAAATSPLQAGQLYDLGRLDAERARVADALRNEGWYRIKAADLRVRRGHVKEHLPDGHPAPGEDHGPRGTTTPLHTGIKCAGRL
jgi:outer membrane protein assembly factor BamA